ncbi:bifunctional DNA-formamidopyrimidine glycosylase/DNA-(apurinic or apyrimidinic site) lyase [Thermodesulfatator atlanticus]|uniref:bifunctional DNA-formamidopyrimidine glycosylase/DNA-(apurinic or apyrimidinic site) lyase n=1 Tax=Thermodesulfatator atlanticus TaxID=501497 RepID=UPI0003B2F664|nr:bifunctional DNA-formamidopyrimidine glycosylase/DNA-(apurinic or apyrimidinic site) lyase [Thermodesulfatator atlanticus]
MPELPEVETIKNTLASKITGKKIIDVRIGLPKLVSPQPGKFIELIKGQEIKNLLRKGKFLIIELSNDLALLVHFRLTGQLVYLEDSQRPPQHTHIIFSLTKGTLCYADLRQFGRLELLRKEALTEHKSLLRLGPEPFDIKNDDFLKILQKSSRKIKALLLDQEKIAGLGNIYVDEALFRAKIRPDRPANTLNPEEAKRLLSTIKNILKEATSLGGSSVRNYVDGEGNSGRFQERHLVYGKRGKPCPNCQRALSYTTIANRGTTFCPSCQK